jgi:hypothetical protein
LDCCLMLDDDGHDAREVEVAACGLLLRLLGWEQSNASTNANEEEEGREEGGGGGGGSWGTGKIGCRRWECGGPNNAFENYLVH